MENNPHVKVDGNRLIAEFMGHGGGASDECGNKPADYHSSWDWLMPVVEKIEEPCSFPDKTIKEGVDVKIFYRNCMIEYSDDDNEYNESPDGEKGKTKIEATWKAVIKFIQWYNQHKKETV